MRRAAVNGGRRERKAADSTSTPSSASGISPYYRHSEYYQKSRPDDNAPQSTVTLGDCAEGKIEPRWVDRQSRSTVICVRYDPHFHAGWTGWTGEVNMHGGCVTSIRNILPGFILSFYL